MCFFNRPNPNIKSRAYELGMTDFECGHCPECLSKRAKQWALRCTAEAQISSAIMVTLTYDDYKYDSRGKIVGELPPKKLNVNKEHVQKFVKRLRKHFLYDVVAKPFRKQVTAYFKKQVADLAPGERRHAISKLRKKYAADIEAELQKRVDSLPKIKYMITAEYGNRTHRAHYHAILFNVDFADKIRYKKSKRGNLIYKSKTLTDIWGHGICTIDSINVNGKVARYCTKYCAKDSRCSDTFMLFSRDIGSSWLLENFNARSYMLDGIEYPIPKLIWNKRIESVFANNYIFNRSAATYKYRSFDWFLEHYDVQLARQLADWQLKRNRIFSNFKHSYAPYKQYLDYWSKKAELINLTRGSDIERILALDETKYHFYKNAAVAAKLVYARFGSCVIPRTGKTLAYKWKTGICPAPLVIKGQMTLNNKTKIVKTVYWSKNLQDFIYLRPQKGKCYVQFE